MTIEADFGSVSVNVPLEVPPMRAVDADFGSIRVVEIPREELERTLVRGVHRATEILAPVAMQSNLHNALFVPADGVLYVANLSHSKPAAEMPYMKLNLYELLKSTGQMSPRAAVAR